MLVSRGNPHILLQTAFMGITLLPKKLLQSQLFTVMSVNGSELGGHF